MDSTAPQTSPSYRSKAIDVLLGGRDVATRLKTTFTSLSTHQTDDQSVMVDQILSSFSQSLSLLRRDSEDPDEVSQFPVSSPDSGESIKSSGTLKERRGCYKRRKTAHSRSEDRDILVDDGHQWRKYGQKTILQAKYPRNYFRCTHKFDQHCQATKQVQRISEDPPMYRTTYYGHHTCKNLFKPSHLLVDITDPSDSHIISFATASAAAANNSPCKQEATDTFLLPYFQSSAAEQKECCSKNERDDGCLTGLNNNSLSSSDYLYTDQLLTHVFDHGDAISSCTTATTSSSVSTHDDIPDDMKGLMEIGDFEYDDFP